MKRSFLTVLAASSLLVLGACGADDDQDNIEPVEDVQQPLPPPPAPMPIDSPMDTTGMGTMTTTG